MGRPLWADRQPAIVGGEDGRGVLKAAALEVSDELVNPAVEVVNAFQLECVIGTDQL